MKPTKITVILRDVAGKMFALSADIEDARPLNVGTRMQQPAHVVEVQISSDDFYFAQPIR